jgi:outer membrane protein
MGITLIFSQWAWPEEVTKEEPEEKLDKVLSENHQPPVELPDLTPHSASIPNPTRDQAIPLNMNDSIQVAIKNATSVLKAQNDDKLAGAQLLQSYGQFLPSLSSTANYNYSSGTTYYAISTPTLVNGRGIHTGFTISSTLNLFNGLADYSNIKSFLLKKEASEWTVTRAQQQIALDISQSFLQVILDNRIVDIARKNLQESQAREKLLEAQTQLGARSLADLFRQQAQTSSDESFLLTSENKTRSDQLTFLKKMRVDITKRYRFIEPSLQETHTNEKYQNEATLLELALKSRVDLKAANSLANAAHWDVQVNSANYLPKLDLVGTAISGAQTLFIQNVNGVSVVPASQNNLGYQLGHQINYTIGLVLTWNLFDRFLTYQNTVKARINADNQDLFSEDKKLQVESDVRNAFSSYQLAIQQLRASKKGLESAQKAYTVMEGRYKVGAANFIDLINSQAALVQAESARAQALIDFQLQSKTVEFALGVHPDF